MSFVVIVGSSAVVLLVVVFGDLGVVARPVCVLVRCKGMLGHVIECKALAEGQEAEIERVTPFADLITRNVGQSLVRWGRHA